MMRSGSSHANSFFGFVISKRPEASVNLIFPTAPLDSSERRSLLGMTAKKLDIDILAQSS